MDLEDVLSTHASLIEEAVADCVARGVTDEAGIQAALVAAHKRQRAKMDEMVGELYAARMSNRREMPAWYNYIAHRLYTDR